MNPITSISSNIAAPSTFSAKPSSSPGEFQELLSTSMKTVEGESAKAQEAVQQFLSGESDDVHKVALAAQRAELSSELFMQMRNKMISAYQEIMKMQM